ncbi:hypothetical protein ONE63_001169 [Megalurothrips usitatus]|uniref:Cathepsin L1-like n=1 Tax=Megalurothrips usitatus TaxID=439358 RepID=A0AAV7XBC0_9NEOP|nr:hypothetical protein ONE63_001169 [Megalurothrips usitatus]
MKVLLVVASLAAVACAVRIPDAEVKSQFESFKLKHGKSYASPHVELHRSKIFKENLLRIAQHNERYHRGEESFTLAVNQFADLLTHELVEAMNGFRANSSRPSRKVHFAPANHKAAESVDWRKSGYVTPVKDQGSCGSCWTFSATGALEGQLAKKTGKLVSLSEQNLVDCTRGQKYQMEGCNGGTMDAAFQYIADNDGIDSETSYPYTARDGYCGYDVKNKAGSDTGFVDVNPTEKDLQHAVETVGPVSVAIDASPFTFSFYSGGVYSSWFCGNSERSLDHGVLAVGYGTTSGKKGQDYWIVKNSWGPHWGENGYIRMARNHKNSCGIATMASYPTV